MIKSMPKASVYELTIKAGVGVLILYALVATVLLIKFDPKPFLMLVTSHGTYQVKEIEGQYAELERQNFIEEFFHNLYEYDDKTYLTQISNVVAKKMNAELWERKKSEFESNGKKMASEPITESFILKDLRKIDDTHYEADLAVKIVKRLKTDFVKLRVSIEVGPRSRSESNPYPYEVKNYDEQIN